MNRLAAAACVLLGALALYPIAESVAAPASPKGKVSFTGLGVEIDDVNTAELPVVSYWKSGRVEFEQTNKVQVKGKGDHTVVAKARHDELAAGGKLRVDITDQDGGQTTAYGYDPSTNAITLTTGGAVTTVIRNPDGSYLVDGAAAATGKAAAAMVTTTAAYKGASPHGVMVAYAYAQNAVSEAKQPTNCNGRNLSIARGPAVCTVFADLCECLACDASGKGSSCASCR